MIHTSADRISEYQRGLHVAAFIEKHRKTIFYIILGTAFFMIYAYNLLTPYFSDDYAYLNEVRNASGILELIRQQYGEYLSNSGRVIGQFNVRLSLYGSKQIFNVVNSGMFLALVLLIYHNIRGRKKHDIFVLLLIITFLWKFSVEFGQTMLWICGACNYLWGSVIILGFVTFYRYLLEHADKKRKPWFVLLVLLFGIAAGWCNENTSGGGLLLVLLFGLNFGIERKKEGKHGIYPFMIAGVAGLCLGLLGMVMAPGVRSRSAVMSEGAYTGIVGLLSRIYKTTVSIRELFFPLLVIMVIVFVILAVQKKLTAFADIRKNSSVLFFAAFLATSYVLSLIPTPMDRAFFGAGVFLMTACIQGIVEIKEEESFARVLKYSLVSVLCLWLFFTYLENLVNLARIYREEKERIELILADKADPEGDGIVVVPQYREAFRNDYSVAHDSDMTEDKDYWINFFYEIYYEVGNITAIPRDEWDLLYGTEEGEQ
jgi:hypothetical protein